MAPRVGEPLPIPTSDLWPQPTLVIICLGLRPAAAAVKQESANYRQF